MAYQPNKPEATDQLSQSQTDLQNNFQSINTSFNQNHVTFDIADTGKHKFIQFPVQAADPVAVAGQVDVYNKLFGAVNELYIQKSNGTQVPVTASTQAQTGYCYLPCGLIMKWGRGTVNASAASAATAFEATVPFTAVYSANATLNGRTGMDKGCYIQTLTTTHITVYNANANGGARTFYYFVIGV
jgi:hypothetical protein